MERCSLKTTKNSTTSSFVKNKSLFSSSSHQDSSRTMKKASSQSLVTFFEESDSEDSSKKKKAVAMIDVTRNDRFYMDDINQQVSHLAIQPTVPSRRYGETQPREKHGLWTNEQKARAAKLEKQLRARWELEDLIEQQLNSFQSHYKRAMIPTTLKDVSQLLMPKGTSPLELAATTWFGDWRPSAILDLLQALSPSFTSESAGAEKVLAQLVKDIRIEETVIDEEMAEIQANCILHLPFGLTKGKNKSLRSLDSIHNEFQKIHRVISKAQNLRLKVLEVVVKKVLGQTDAAEFLVAFAGIQDSIHHFTTEYRLNFKERVRQLT